MPDDRTQQPRDIVPASPSRSGRHQPEHAVVVTDGRGGIEYLNPAAERLFGYSMAEARGRDLRRLLVPASGHGHLDRTLRTLRPLQPRVAELTVRDRRGREFQMWVSLTRLADPDGRAANYVAVSTDPTDSRAGAGDTEMLASIVAGSADAIVAADMAGRITWANHATRDVFGWSPGDLVGRHSATLVPEDLREEDDARQRQVAEGLSVPPFVTTRLRADGTVFDASVTIGARTDAGGRIVGTSSTIRDVTQQRRAESELQELVRRYTAQFEQVSLPQASLDLDGRVLAVNDAACRLLRLEREQLLGTSSVDLVHPMDRQAAQRRFRELLRDDTSDWASYELVARRPDGSSLPLLLDVTLLRDAPGPPYAVAVFGHDLTEIHEAQRRLSSQESLFRALNRRASDAAVVMDTDSNIVLVSPSVTEVFGYRPEELLAMSGYELVHPEDVEEVRRQLAEVLREPDGSRRLLLRVKDAWGRWRSVEETVTNCVNDPDIGGLVLNLRDITAEVRAQEALRESEARYRAIAETAQEGILVLARDGRVLFANQKMADIVGFPLEELYRRGLLGLLAPEEAATIARRLASRESRGPERYELPYRHPSGRRMWLSVSVTPLRSAEERGSLAMVSDVTEARQAEAELRRQALHDALTGLPNRTLLMDRLNMAAMRHSRGEAGGIAVLFLDLDHFKMVNDSRGHHIGDQLLRAVAGRLQDAVRRVDTVARLGGDEFAVVCENADVTVAEAVAVRIQEALREPLDVAGQSVYASASIGIALSPPHDPDLLLRHADAAMYQGKAAGRGGAVVFDRALEGRSRRRLAVVTALRQALSEEAITVHYQPVVDLHTGRLVGVEALLRWAPPGLGPVPPEEVVTAAEESGLSLELDTLVLRSACGDIGRLHRDARLPSSTYVAVNLSPHSASREPLAGIVRDVLAGTGLPASSLMLELTENSVMRDPERATELLRGLTAQGVTVAVDDFGTGYSSLAYLQRLPVDVLKIDRSFVENVVRDADADAIVTSIVRLGNTLDLQIVAEGIELREQADAMRDMGAHAGQGFLWGPAVPAAALPTLDGVAH